MSAAQSPGLFTVQYRRAPTEADTKREEGDFSLARFLPWIALGLTLFMLAFLSELYDTVTPNGEEWAIIPRTVAALIFWVCFI